MAAVASDLRGCRRIWPQVLAPVDCPTQFAPNLQCAARSCPTSTDQTGFVRVCNRVDSLHQRTPWQRIRRPGFQQSSTPPCVGSSHRQTGSLATRTTHCRARGILSSSIQPGCNTRNQAFSLERSAALSLKFGEGSSGENYWTASSTRRIQL